MENASGFIVLILIVFVSFIGGFSAASLWYDPTEKVQVELDTLMNTNDEQFTEIEEFMGAQREFNTQVVGAINQLAAGAQIYEN